MKKHEKIGRNLEACFPAYPLQKKRRDGTLIKCGNLKWLFGERALACGLESVGKDQKRSVKNGKDRF